MMMVLPAQANDPQFRPGILMAVHLLRTCADGIDDRHCGPPVWHHRIFGNLSPWAMRKAATWLEDHIEKERRSEGAS